MQPGDLRRFNDDSGIYPGQVFLVLDVEEMDARYTTQETSVTFLIDGTREFGWHGELLEEMSEMINEAR